jgi:hypothetical protein
LRQTIDLMPEVLCRCDRRPVEFVAECMPL